MLVNLTPHPISVFPADCPDRIAPGQVAPRLIIQPSARFAPLRLEERPTHRRFSVPARDRATSAEMVNVVELVYSVASGPGRRLPEQDHFTPHRTWYIVSLAAALPRVYGRAPRTDLLVPHRHVRDLDGTVIGCRQLARPA